MTFRPFHYLGVTLTLLLAMALTACSSEEPAPATPVAATAIATAMPSPTPEPTVVSETFESLFKSVSGVVDPSNFGWPRDVEGLNGLVSIPQKPERIITASIGHDEVTLAIVPVERLVGVGAVSKDATFSNVAPLVQDIAEVSRDPETIIALSPDVVVTSPYFPAEGVEALSRAGIPVIQTELQNDPEARISSILFIGYIYGEEQRAIEFGEEVRDRYESLVAVTSKAAPRPRVLAVTEYSDMLWVAGAKSTEGGVIAAAGGINAAAEAGIEGNQTTSLEGVIAMNPEVIVIPQPVAFGAEEFRESLLSNEALSEVPAVKDNRVHVVDSKLFTTLSHWNILGVEELASTLWPNDFPEPTTVAFSTAE